MRLPIPLGLAARLIDRAKRTPYSHLHGYMNRYWLVPYANYRRGEGCGPVRFRRRPLAWLLQRFGIAIRIHQILRSDLDRGYHDHPWNYLTVLLRGSYCEVTPLTDSAGAYIGPNYQWYSAGSVLCRSAKSKHRLVLAPGTTVWTLFITGRRTRRWRTGFFVSPGDDE